MGTQEEEASARRRSGAIHASCGEWRGTRLPPIGFVSSLRKKFQGN